jgi:hypothetical protein
MVSARKPKKLGRNTYSNVTFSVTSTAINHSELNPGVEGEKPAPNAMRQDTATIKQVRISRAGWSSRKFFFGGSWSEYVPENKLYSLRFYMIFVSSSRQTSG